MAEPNGKSTSQPPPKSPSSPHSYPSPQMQPTYAYPPPHGQPGTEAYRHSPTGMTAVNLPPLRSTMDGQHQPGLQGPVVSPQSTVPPMPQYFPTINQQIIHPPQPLPQSMQLNHMRYLIPAQTADARMLSGGRHKKEIKRRTKTGCLTCRKRRIKCDEQHPVCRNCQKSKRDCLGYDPLFRGGGGGGQQQAQGQSSAQTNSPTSNASTPISAQPTSTLPPTSNQSQSPPSAGLGAMASSRSTPSKQPNELNTAIDPALSASANPTPVKPQMQKAAIPIVAANAGKPTQIENLFTVNGHAPYDVPASTAPLPEDVRNDIKTLYVNDFGPGFDALLETKWYTESGLEKLLENPEICQLMATLFKYYGQASTDTDVVAVEKLRALEARAVWKLLSMCRNHAGETGEKKEPNGTNGAMPPSIHLAEVTQRLKVLELLLTIQTANSNPLKEVDYSKLGGLSQAKQEEIKFWYHVGTFVSEPPGKPESAAELKAAVSSCRSMLNGRENRDVIYSIMVVRHLGPKVVGFPAAIRQRAGGEEDDNNKVFIAKTFLVEQDAFRATNHPMQRVCHMAIEAWALR